MLGEVRGALDRLSQARAEVHQHVHQHLYPQAPQPQPAPQVQQASIELKSLIEYEGFRTRGHEGNHHWIFWRLLYGRHYHKVVLTRA